ncbi:hypothetical protein ALC56_08184 [Trachymyrmex septentrionalis]|uniref:DUF4371 domain-containing protein n=1 Tax=Trachymyrmex septentrionalis TaxID=34720 RepID=A0A151JVL6_9HYME|nr:hypothetical protein ALC56_08184 [Trachymyrmex septentrionalis]
MNSDNSDDGLVTLKKKKVSTWRKQSFTTAWLQLPEFSSEDKYNAKYKVCNKVLVARRSELEKHVDTSTHTKNKGQTNKFKHSNVCTKTLINYLLANDIKIQCAEDLKNNLLLVDESTDLNNDKNLCILVRYYKNSKCITHLLDLVNMLADSSTALKAHNLNNPNIFVLGCICYSVYLIASHAADELRKNVESLMHSLYSYFSRSPKRQEEILLEEIQSIKKEKHRMINPNKTRWLALRKSVNRILKQWILFCSKHFYWLVLKTKMADLENNPCIKAYFEFMQYVLLYMHTLDTLFQSEKYLISNLYTENVRFLRLLCSNFIKFNYLTQEYIANLNLNNPNILLPNENINIAMQCRDIKTKKHNRLSTKTICSLLRIKMQMENLKVNATNYPLREELFKKYNLSYYY